MEAVEWAVWTAAAAIAIGLVGFMRAHARRGTTIHMLQIFQAALMLCCVGIFPFFTWDKFHLIWLLPACWFGGFLGFILFPLPLIGPLLRMITLTFASVFFLGTGADVGGV